MRFRKVHELFPWDERAIFRALEGAKLKVHSDEEWPEVLAAHRSPPNVPPVGVTLDDTTIALHPIENVGQLELGAIAQELSDWRISNLRDVIDPELPFRLWPVLGSEAFTKANSWRRRVYDVPLLLRRDDQAYVAGWDGLHAALAADPDPHYSVGELREIGEKATVATLPLEDANDFLMARR